MVKTGVVIPLYFNQLLGEDGELEANSDAPDLMPFAKLYQSIHKKAPSGRHWDALKATYIAQAMQRVVMMTPGTPPENRCNHAARLHRHDEGLGIRRRVQKGDTLGA